MLLTMLVVVIEAALANLFRGSAGNDASKWLAVALADIGRCRSSCGASNRASSALASALADIFRCGAGNSASKGEARRAVYLASGHKVRHQRGH